MKEDVLKFRKCVEMLKSEKGYTNEKLCKELGISDPTLFKLMTIDLTELKGLRASTLGIIQDFMKAHCNDINYAGIEPDTSFKVDADKLRKNLGNYQEPRKEKEKAIEIHTDEQKGNHSSEILEQTSNPFDLFLEALKSVPSNVTIHILINDK